MSRAVSFALIGLFIWGSSARAVDGGPPVFDALQETLDRVRSESGCIGASAAVILSGEEMWRGVSGWSDPVTSDPITPDMLFDMGSAGKNLLAALMVKLAEEGLLSLEDPIDRYLPPFPHGRQNYHPTAPRSHQRSLHAGRASRVTFSKTL